MAVLLGWERSQEHSRRASLRLNGCDGVAQNVLDQFRIQVFFEHCNSTILPRVANSDIERGDCFENEFLQSTARHGVGQMRT